MLIRANLGDRLIVHLHNELPQPTTLHWHGVRVPIEMDGVPGISFPSIMPGETFTYEFPIRQSGTYWYHSHSGMQEAMGHYGPIVIDPAANDTVSPALTVLVAVSAWQM